ncbi:2-C-methyl-D-erythritol 2,4-cyclodiphosphate synthase [Anaerobranca californiensis DSM 14826]|uniref:2-C-methyl-D-erythritol 2,4-cyclodiphosphate synthase n=1 Tax=Anaerobranca californiensis DSM 14826 TaxID=1120989 RepID=A0A1M6QYU3_9FIRM|nr:2-C-methyl-D-erythritol 2,4-cyclodiphosphate synthase [Anaerobranca californiensis]SHK25401.1 2-C-methyl-D-erythritol 2,4-cyclodiphosphate synthase [Anaerobranca californiensis DSM 14826]
MKVGLGFDVHKLVDNRKLIIGGVEIPYDKGLEGHSDADVLVHAIMDSLLGPANLGDIGKIFPDTNEEFKGISSLILLEKVKSLLEERGYSIINIDCVIMAEKPKMAPYIKKMQQKIASILKIDEEAITIKATTTEKLGFVGRQEGIAAQAISLIKLNNNKNMV